MPLARILTRFPEHAVALSEELRHHGYTVEFSSPGVSAKSAADLEIDFELCAEQDALSRASELAEQFDADVAVSPGALHAVEAPATVVEPAVTETLEPPVAVQQASDETLPLEPLAETQITAPETAAIHEAEIALPPNMLSELAPEIESHAMSAEPQQVEPEWGDVSELPSGVRTEPAAQPWEQAPYEPLVEEPVVRANAALDDEINLAHAAGESSESAPGTHSLAHEGSAAPLHPAAVAGGQLWAKTRDVGEGFWDSARQVAAEYREGLRVRRAEARAERAHKLLQLEKRRAMAEERAAELEAAREAASARLQHLLRERGGLTPSQPVPPQRPTPAPVPVVTPQEERTPITERLGAYVQRLRIPIARSYRPQMEAVLMGVAAACALFVLGLAVASFHAKPAISSSINVPNTASQKGSGVTVQTGGVTLKPVQPSTTTPASPSQSTSVAQKAPVAKPAPGISAGPRSSADSDVTVRHVSAAKPTPRQSDVVIRHYNAPSPKPAQTPAQAGLKHISDLDN